MADRKAHRRRVHAIAVVAGVAIGLAFDSLDVLVDVGMLHGGPLLTNLGLAPEAWMRGAFLVLAVLGSLAYARLLLAKEDVATASERYRTLAESARDDIFIVGRDYRIAYMNTQAAMEFGRTPAELEGKRLGDLFPAEEADQARADVEKAFAGEEAYSELEFTFDGTSKWLGTRLVPMRERDGAVDTVLGISRDISHMKRDAALRDALTRISEVVHSRLSVDEILEAVTVEVASATGADSSVVLASAEGGWTVRFAHGLPEDLVGAHLSRGDAPGAERAIATGAPLHTDDAPHDDRLNAETVQRFGICSMIEVPLLTRRGAEGVLLLGHRTKRAAFPTDVLDFITRVGTTVSLAIDNARLYEEERTVADELQSAILMLPETLPGIDFAREYRSATEAARVGGDFYDLFQLEHDRIGITIGDISGHGIDAAVLTSLVKNGIRVEATQEDRPPHEVVASASRLLLEDSPAEMFATVFFGVLDLDDGTLAYCNAGHTTGFVCCGSDCVRPLPSNSPLAGALPDAEFSLSTDRIGADEVLFVYTDGLTEARRDGGDLFGEERLLERLRECAGEKPAEVVAHVMGAVLDFSGDRLRDDLAILSLQPVCVEEREKAQALTSRTAW